MPELQHTFTAGRMNKDLDERMVPNGEYRDALNIEVSTSEDSNMGAVQTTLGNTKLSNIFNEKDFRCIGAITDDKIDAAYWFIASHKTHSHQFYIDSLATDLTKPVVYKDVIAEFKNGNVNPVIVDISKVITYGNILPLAPDTIRVTNINGIPTVGINEGILPGMSVRAVTVSGASDLLDANGVEITTGVQVIGVDYTSNRVTISQNITINSNSSDPLAYLAFEHPTPALNFDVDHLITGINIIDDMLFWTDNYSEPKKINITRCKEGSKEGFNKHTRFLTPLYYSRTGDELVVGGDFGSGIGMGTSWRWWPYTGPGSSPWNLVDGMLEADPNERGSIATTLSKNLVKGKSYRLRISVTVPPTSVGSLYVKHLNGWSYNSGTTVNNTHGKLDIPTSTGTFDLYWTQGSGPGGAIYPPGFNSSFFVIHHSLGFSGKIDNVSVVEMKKKTIPTELTPLVSSPGIMEEHITVIKESPLTPPALEMSQTKNRTTRDITGNLGPIPDSVAEAVFDDIFWGVNQGVLSGFGPDNDQDSRWVLLTGNPDFKVGDTLIFESDPDFPEKTVRAEVIEIDEVFNSWDWNGGPPNIPDNTALNPFGAILSSPKPMDDIFDLDQSSPTYGHRLYMKYKIRILSTDLAVAYGDLAWIVKLEQPDPIFEFKFPRFAYRYKYQDNEYSAFSPFSEVAFLPGRPGDDDFEYLPKKGYNLGMTNNLRFLAVKDWVAENDLLPDGVVAIDILYKESNSPNIYKVKTFTPSDIEWQVSIDGGHTKGYMEITSEVIHAVLPSNQLLRPWDNVPRKALAQEITGNRLVYGNYLQNYTTGIHDVKIGLKSISLSRVKNAPEEIFPEEAYNYLPAKSIKTLRTYQLGVVFKDRYGRETPVLSENRYSVTPEASRNSLYLEKKYADKQNKLWAQLRGAPPPFATSFKFFIKETSNEYYNIAMDRWYDAQDENIWISFPSSERNKLDIETFLILKKEKDVDVFVPQPARYKVLAIEDDPPEFIKTKSVILGTINNGYSDIASITGTGFPKMDGTFVWIEKDAFEEVFGDLGEALRGKSNLYLRMISDFSASLWYYIQSFVFLDSQDDFFQLNIEGVFGNDMNFTSTNDDHASRITDLKLQIKDEVIEHKPEFDGRFFVKIHKDNILEDTVIKRDQSKIRYAPVMERSVAHFGSRYNAWSKGVWFPSGNQTNVGSVQPTWYGWGHFDIHSGTWGDGDEFWPDVGVGVWMIDDGTAYRASNTVTDTRDYIDRIENWHKKNGNAGNHYDHGAIAYSASGSDNPILKEPDGIRDHTISLSISCMGQHITDHNNWDIKTDLTDPEQTGLWAVTPGMSDSARVEEINFIKKLRTPGTLWRWASDPGQVIYKTTKFHGSSIVFNYYDRMHWQTRNNKQGAEYSILAYNQYGRRHHFVFDAEVFEFNPSGGGGDKIGSVGPYYYKPTNDPRWIFNDKSNWKDIDGNTADVSASSSHDFNPKGAAPGLRSDLMSNGQIDQYGNIIGQDESQWDGSVIWEILEPVDEGDINLASHNPAVFETEPKEDVGLDIYHEVGQAYPVTLNAKTNEQFIPIGCAVTCYRSGVGIIKLNTGNDATIKVVACNENSIRLEDALGIPLDGSSGQTAPQVSSTGSFYDTLTFTRADGSTTEAWVNAVSSNVYYLHPEVWSQLITLPWFNCYSFGNGVESDRIRDDYNQVKIDNGPKASTTLDEPYEEERRSSGLIYSGIYNSISGVNNLNQFIQAEKITKDLNPTYGSIQKLHSRNTDLITLCEDRVLKILANKDAMFNADGNTNVTSNLNVLGQSVPFVGEYGISKNPESFASESYRAYFTDKYRGTVLRLSQDGLTPISEAGMKDWFSDNLKHNKYIIGSYDNRKSTYNATLVNWESRFNDVVKISGYDPINSPDWISVTSNSWSGDMSSAVKVGMEVVITDPNSNMVFPSGTTIINANHSQWTVQLSNPPLTDSSGISLLPTSSTISTYADFSITLVNTSNNTISFNERAKGWESFKSFIQEQGFSLNNEYYTFNAGELYKHHNNPIRNKFYEKQYYSSVTVLFNEGHEAIKSFQTLNYEGSQAKTTLDINDPEYYNNTEKFGWYVDLMETNLQTGSSLEFKSKEDKWFGYVKGESTYWDNSGSAGNVDTREFSVQGIGNASDITHDVPIVFGCMDPAATNYNPSANMDDGSCVYPPGATWNCECDEPRRTTEIGVSRVATRQWRCVDPGDGTGTYTDIGACRNNCVGGYCGPDTYDCVVDAITRQYSCVINSLGTGQYSSITDCQNSGCTGYGGPPTWDCTPSGCLDPGDGTGQYSSLSACMTIPCLGCTDIAANNYNPSAVYNDGSCIGPGETTQLGICKNSITRDPDFQLGLDTVSGNTQIETSDVALKSNVPINNLWKGFHSSRGTTGTSGPTLPPSTNSLGLTLTAGEPGALTTCGVYQVIDGLLSGQAYELEVRITRVSTITGHGNDSLFIGNVWNNTWVGSNAITYQNIGGTSQLIPITGTITGTKRWQFTAAGGPESKVLVLDYQAINGESIVIEKICISKL